MLFVSFTNRLTDEQSDPNAHCNSSDNQISHRWVSRVVGRHTAGGLGWWVCTQLGVSGGGSAHSWGSRVVGLYTAGGPHRVVGLHTAGGPHRVVGLHTAGGPHQVVVCIQFGVSGGGSAHSSTFSFYRLEVKNK